MQRVAGGSLTTRSGPSPLTKGHRADGAAGTLGLSLAGRTISAVAQTNNGLGDAWQGNRNRGGTPQQVVSVKPARHSQIISTHAPPFPPAGNDQRCSQPAPDAVPASCKASERIASR